MRRIVVLAMAGAALSACHKPTPANEATASAQASAPANTGAPHRRAGLWQTDLTVDGHHSPMSEMKLCVDAAMEARSSAFHPSNTTSSGEPTKCAWPAPSRGLDGSYSVSVTCPLSGGGQMATKVTATGDWSSAYHIHMESDTTGAPVSMANGHHVTDMDGKWLGPCPEGMAGGDMELNGMRISGGKLAGAAKMLRGMSGDGSTSSGAQ